MAAEEKKTKKPVKTTVVKTKTVAKAVKAPETEKQVAGSKAAAEIDANYGKDMSTAGFAISIASIFINFFTLGILAIVGLVLSIIGRVQTSKTGRPNSMALAGIIISSIVIALSTLAFLFFIFVAIIAGSDSRLWHEESGSSLESECSQPEHRMSEDCRNTRDGQEPMFEFQPNSL